MIRIVGREIVILILGFLILYGCITSNQEKGLHRDTNENQPDTCTKSDSGTDGRSIGEDSNGKGSDTEDGEAEKTLPVFSPAPFKREKVHREIRKLFHPPEYPLISSTSVLYIIHDFTSDGEEEVCVLGIQSDNPQHSHIDFISDFSRLFKEKRDLFPFYFYILSLHGDTCALVNKIPLGEHSVYESITKFNLNKAQPDPVVIAVAFQIKEGSIQKWLVFKSPGIYPVATITLIETVSSKASVEDIDADGILDIVLSERGMEEGVGYETFLTWNKWDGRKFIEYKTTNVVRNLNSFLEKVKEGCLSGNIEELLSFSLAPDEKKRFERMGMSRQQILFHLFGLAQFFESDFTGINVLDGIEEIIFPEILDNPFYVKDEKGSYFKLAFRIIYGNGLSVIPEVLIYMLKNPFGKRQFVFYPLRTE